MRRDACTVRHCHCKSPPKPPAYAQHVLIVRHGHAVQLPKYWKYKAMGYGNVKHKQYKAMGYGIVTLKQNVFKNNTHDQRHLNPPSLPNTISSTRDVLGTSLRGVGAMEYYQLLNWIVVPAANRRVENFDRVVGKSSRCMPACL